MKTRKQAEEWLMDGEPVTGVLAWDRDMESKCFDDVVKDGRMLGFCGVNENCFKIGPYVFEAMEAEVDGYRSCMKEIKKVDREERDRRHLHFFKNAIASVKVIAVSSYMTDWGGFKSNLDGHQLVDGSGHVWLTFGTDHTDDYYHIFCLPVYT